MSSQWTETAAQYVTSTQSCPRCDTTLAQPGHCTECGADLAGPQAKAVWNSSLAVAAALRERQALIDGLPNFGEAPVAIPALVAAPAGAPAVASGPIPAVAEPATRRTSSQLSVQSVLAVAGAGLFAVAAIVFTFFNPDLTDLGTRSAIVAGISAVFIGGAWLLAWRGLTFSAEAVGALGAVFLGLDVWSFSQAAPDGVSEWLFGGIGMLVAAASLLALAALVRLRTWLWAALVGIALTPAPFAYAVDSAWAPVVGHLVVGFAALGAHVIARRFAGRFASPLAADHGTATVITLLVLAVVPLQLVLLPVAESPTRVGLSSAVLAALALVAWLAALQQLRRFWLFASGALITAAVALLPLVADLYDWTWYLAFVPAAAAVALVVIALIRRPSFHAGALTIALACAVPAAGVASNRLTAMLLGGGEFTGNATTELAALFGLAATALACGFLAWRTRGARTLAFTLWIACLALLALTVWSALALPTQIVATLALAVVLSAVVVRVRLPLVARVPLAVTAHVGALMAAVISWHDPASRVLAGAAAVATLFAVARTVPLKVRPVHVGVGYAYALVIVAAALDLAGFETIAVLCLTTTVGSLAALAVTLVGRFRPGTWYAVLIVTAVPFAIGIVSVLLDRSGWTALSTGVTFALLLAIMLTRRPGLTLVIRAGAAALLVPALAVVVICLGAQVLSVSASPITLPVIAVIVACTLPATGLIAAAVAAQGVSAADAAVVRVWIEISSLVTGAIAVVLALVRSAAGIPTTFLVLVILGIGAIATAVFAKRRYGWPVAGIAFTGALWCVWWLAGITVLEPYLLPPALGTALVAAILVARDRPGMGISAVGLYWTGLGVAAVPTLVLLALSGSDQASLPWRSLGLLGAALVLMVFAALIPRLVKVSALRRIGPLRAPTLVVAIGAASAGAIQGIRYGLGLDAVAVASRELVMLPVLGFAVAATVLAVVAARMLGSRSRWSYVPATVYLVAGPIAAIREGWFPILTVLALALLLLALMIVTTVRARSRAVTLPPVWLTFVLAWCTAVASWSQRELRVEAYSLPLGLALLAVGIIAMRPLPAETADTRPTLTSWPIGFSGSWRLLTPGIVVTLLPSILATGTDPRTERAILVIALALIAILIGSIRRLAAPFILGIIALPIENIVVFAVQIGRNIGALPWWITLATAGAVLLVIAVGSERRTGKDKGTAARLRDLR
ncbi:MAG: hypothetical protein LCH43_11580 [Actinobacteria bacterium]|nr:hypothetical protein [Actinomycetota bacterium]